MSGTIVTLASRAALAAVDSSPVTGTEQRLPGRAFAATFIVSTTGSPTTYDARACIETSTNGTTWHQVLRFKDITNAATANQFVRLPGITAAASADFVTSDTGGTAAASATIVDAPWPVLVRAITNLETLTGGTSPTVTLTVALASQ